MEIPKLICQKCGWVWIPRTANPKRCPNPSCQAKDWDTYGTEEITAK